jgi:hypothetical protein
VDVALAPLPDRSGPLTDPGPDVATGLAYGDLSAYRALAPGSYAVSVRAAGASADTPPALSTRIEVPDGAAMTVALSGLFADLSLAVLPDDLSAPAPGAARVRVLAAAADAGPVTVTTATGATLAEDLDFPAAGDYVDVPAGPAGIRLEGAEPLALDLAAGSVLTLLVLDQDDGIAVRAVVDAAGPATVPVGGVAAGTGPAGVPVGPLVAGTLVGLLALARRTRVPLLVVAAVATALVAATGAPPAVPVPPSAPISVAAAASVPAPVRVRARGVDAAVLPVGVDAAGVLGAPSDPLTAGWYSGGPAPGSAGPAVLTAHVDRAGAAGAFAALGDLRAGDTITVERADGSVARFTVTRVVRIAKAAFPAAEVYGPTPDAQLRLVTCGGRFDRAAGSYEDNVVVFAR